jgi:hypothetical protein
MARLVGIIVLSLIALSMLWGFARSGAALSAPATIAALLLTVGLPAAGAIALAAVHFGRRGQLGRRREQLRRQTLESEVVRLAGERGGRITSVEVVTELALPLEEVKEVLDSLVMRELADIHVTDSGVLVYDFHDLRHLGEKSTARGVLDA